ncbi:MAG: nucleoside hydrolase [bacterium]|nr:nucleoside hydrolase [bacterium]
MTGGGLKKKILIDCDPGVDDALALALALASPELEVLAVTTVQGNVTAKAAFVNARRALGYFASSLEGLPAPPPVHPGAPLPLRGGRIDHRISYAIHGRSGLGDLFAGGRGAPRLAPSSPAPADEAIVSLARKHGRALTVVALGPLTNLARALGRDREALAGVGRVVVMGGAARMPGNATPAAEFNIHCDPEAAARVLGCGAPLTLVGLDVTRLALLPWRHLAGGGPFRRALRDLTRPYAAFSRRHRGRDAITLHDPLALAVAIRPDLVACERRAVEVDCGAGPARGMTVVDLRAEASRGGKGGIDVALGLREKAFMSFFMAHLRRFRGWNSG